MGMTDDYAIAIQEGATIIRVGRAIFGDLLEELLDCLCPALLEAGTPQNTGGD